jgi:hypothetical protein
MKVKGAAEGTGDVGVKVNSTAKKAQTELRHANALS